MNTILRQVFTKGRAYYCKCGCFAAQKHLLRMGEPFSNMKPSNNLLDLGGQDPSFNDGLLPTAAGLSPHQFFSLLAACFQLALSHQFCESHSCLCYQSPTSVGTDSISDVLPSYSLGARKPFLIRPWLFMCLISVTLDIRRLRTLQPSGHTSTY